MILVKEDERTWDKMPVPLTILVVPDTIGTASFIHPSTASVCVRNHYHGILFIYLLTNVSTTLRKS